MNKDPDEDRLWPEPVHKPAGSRGLTAHTGVCDQNQVIGRDP